MVYPFESWTAFEDDVQGLPKGFMDDYERINGKGSFQKNVGDILDKHANGITNEVQTMVK